MFDFSKAQYAESGVDPFMFERLNEYAKAGEPLGGFLTAVVENDLKGAICGADTRNLAGIHAIVIYICNELPALCQGSPEKVNAWRKMLADQVIA